jgi:Helix-turn-helix domain of resolvase
VPVLNAGVQDVGRPLAASEAQAATVTKLHKAGKSLRAIVDETSLSPRTVRTIVDASEAQFPGSPWQVAALFPATRTQAGAAAGVARLRGIHGGLSDGAAAERRNTVHYWREPHQERHPERRRCLLLYQCQLHRSDQRLLPGDAEACKR